MTVCRFFQQGNCRFGADCRFEHSGGPKSRSSAGAGSNNGNGGGSNNGSVFSRLGGSPQGSAFSDINSNSPRREGGNSTSSAFSKGHFGQSGQRTEKQSPFVGSQRQGDFGSGGGNNSSGFGSGNQSAFASNGGSGNGRGSAFNQGRFGGQQGQSTGGSSPKLSASTSALNQSSQNVHLQKVNPAVLAQDLAEPVPWRQFSAYGPSNLPSMILGGFSFEEARWYAKAGKNVLQTSEFEQQAQRICSDSSTLAEYKSWVQNGQQGQFQLGVRSQIVQGGIGSHALVGQSAFGQSTPSSPSQIGFGSTTTAAQNNLANAAFGQSAFGATPMSAFGATPQRSAFGGGAFGGSTPASGFGQSTSFGNRSTLDGTQQNNAPSVFGSSAAPPQAASAFGAFGSGGGGGGRGGGFGHNPAPENVSFGQDQGLEEKDFSPEVMAAFRNKEFKPGCIPEVEPPMSVR